MTTRRDIVIRLGLAGSLLASPAAALAQSLGFGGTAGGAPQPINITASNGIAWNQNARTVTAMGNAQAVRGKVTITADQLIAHYKPKPGGAGTTAQAKPAATQDGLSGLDSGESQISQLDAVGHVHIFTATDQAFGDHAVYHMARAEMVLTGHNLKLTTPNDVVTARDQIQYWSNLRKAVAVGNAVIVTKDHRSIAADRLTGFFIPSAAQGATPAAADAAPDQSSKLRKVIAEGHVVVRTATDIATGDHGVYHPATGIAILTGNVHITHGPNELAGQEGRVNMKTGIATLIAAPGHRVEGLVLPNSAPPSQHGAAKPPHSGAKPTP